MPVSKFEDHFRVRNHDTEKVSTDWTETIYANKDRCLYRTEDRFRIQVSRYRGDPVWSGEIVLWGTDEKRVTVSVKVNTIRTKTAQKILDAKADYLAKTLYSYLHEDII